MFSCNPQLLYEFCLQCLNLGGEQLPWRRETTFVVLCVMFLEAIVRGYLLFKVSELFLYAGKHPLLCKMWEK